MFAFPNNFLTPATNSQVCPCFLSHRPTIPLSDGRQRPSHWRPCLFTSLKSKNHSWNLEGACKLLLAVRFFPQVGQDPTLSPCKELPNYSVCMVLWAPHQHTLPFGTSYFLLGRIKIIASQMALYGGISLLASTVVQPVCLFASKQTLGELREVNIFAFIIACNAVARGFMKNKLPQEERHLLHYMCSASSHQSSSLQSSLCVCSRRFLEAFFCQGPSLGVCYVHILCIPTAPLCRLKWVLIHSSSWLCTTKLYKCINAAGMNTFMTLCTPMAQWMSYTGSLDQVLNSCEAEGLFITDYLGRAFYQCLCSCTRECEKLFDLLYMVCR